MEPAFEGTCLRDPRQTDLGRRILAESVHLIDARGLEDFTFKRLASVLHTAEASVYRYFENKHRLLIYLVSWYWLWLDQAVAAAAAGAADPAEALRAALRVVSQVPHTPPTTQPDVPPHLPALHRIVVAEASKAFLTKAVDQENREGLFHAHKALCRRLAGLIRAVNTAYPYPVALASTLLETARKQTFFAQHIPSLTEIRPNGNIPAEVSALLEHLAFSALAAPPADTPPPAGSVRSSAAQSTLAV